MENEEESNKHMKTAMEIKIPSETAMTSPTSPPPGVMGLARQGSITKNNNNNCLCSPTNHAGSFRCRLHRTPTTPTSTPALTGLQRTKSTDSSAFLKDSQSNAVNTSSSTIPETAAAAAAAGGSIAEAP